MRDDEFRKEPIDAAGAPPVSWRMATIAVLSMVILAVGALMIYRYSETANAPTQTGFAPIVDEVRPLPSTTGQGGERR